MADCDTIYTIHVSPCTQSADPNHFRETAGIIRVYTEGGIARSFGDLFKRKGKKGGKKKKEEKKKKEKNE